MQFQVICSRCNKKCSESKKCERFDCELPEYFDMYQKIFPRGVPAKYYCSLTGGINSGKTYYLISLVHNLIQPDRDLKMLFAKYKINKVEVIDPISKRLYDDLLYECKMGQLKFTDIRTLGFFNLILHLNNNQIYELVLFNSSGEKIEDEYNARNVRTESHELKGSATMHFLDPREDSQLNEILKKPKDQACSDYDIAEHVFNVLQHVNNGVKLVNNPIAICISKFDLLFSHIPFELPENPFVEAPQFATFFKDIDEVSKSLSAFLKTYSRTVDPADLRSKFNSHRYFALAPFGSDASPAYWKDRKPRGIYAPFFWILKELKILPDYGNRK